MNTAFEDIPLGKFDLTLSGIRITNHSRIRQVEKSMAIHGQLQPVIARLCTEGHQLIDGFKRFYSSENLGMESLQCRLLDIDLSQAKVLLLSYNRPHQSMDAWEEALVLHDLMATHHLDQVTLAEVTGYSRSWVSRRLSLIEKMDPDLSGNIMMGTLTSSHARAIIKLPRGNQGEVAKVILSCHLTSRQSSILIEAFIRATGRPQQEYILTHPLEIIESQHREQVESYDPRLSQHGNEVLRSTRYMKKSLYILAARMHDHRTKELKDREKTLLLEDLVPLSNYYEKLARLITNLKPPLK
jgi:ParB family transcriptional regulator, chromosome partitioning protein